MWRVRNLIQIFLIFFLWDSVFRDPGREVFGYDRAKILTYVLGILIVRAFVLSARAVDVAGEIARGDLSNWLVRPISYFRYWFVRDLSSKLLNLIFVFFELGILLLVLKPPFFVQKDALFIGGFVISVGLAIVLFFTILFLSAMVAFWMPEAIWPVQFLVVAVIIELLSGALFPLDILPDSLQRILYLTPFPYLIFFPLEVYLGKTTLVLLLRGVFINLVWIVIGGILLNLSWRRGVKAYRAEGR